MTQLALPSDFVWLPQPVQADKPTLLLFFHLECAGCVSRAIPLAKDLHAQYGQRLTLLAVHTTYGHRPLTREELLPTLRHFCEKFAKLPFPVALDSGELAAHHAIEGTPHWIALSGSGVRSIFGSQGNAQARLWYWAEEVVGTASGGHRER